MSDPRETARVELHHVDDIAVITLDHPPVNSGNQAIRQGLLDALSALDSSMTRAVVLQGAGNNFMAGADLRELDRPASEPSLPAVTQALTSLSIPVIAVLRGHTLGGGLELAMACDARLATEDARLGLPEVTVGIIPGAGGTQRLPRLVGLTMAIEMVVSGKPVDAQKAKSCGLVDHLLEAADRSAQDAEILDYARRLNGGKLTVNSAPVTCTDRDELQALAKRLVQRHRGLPAAERAAEAVMATADLPLEQGLAFERQHFLSLRDSDSARALRYLFFAERGNPLGQDESVTPSRLDQIAVIGAGTMGSGIALSALRAGYRVHMIERDAKALENGVSRIKQSQQALIERQGHRAETVEALMARLMPGTQLSAVAKVDLVIEAIVEDMTIKQDLFKALDQLVSPAAVLASNTSYLDIEAIAAKVSSPSRVLGLHFFSPADRMPLLEVVETAQTGPATLASGLAFAKRLKKTPIVVRNAWGFVGNRIYAAYRRQCEFMLEEGASVKQIDQALEAYGFAMGPFRVADMSGLDIAWKMRQANGDTRQQKRYVEIPDLLCEAGRFGRKTGQGYYRYDDQGQAHEDPDVTALINDHRVRHNITPQPFSDDDIQKRVVAALINESLLVLEQQVCRRAEDIDIALVNGYGFPRWRGGPVFMARQLSKDALDVLLDQLACASGKGHERANTHWNTARRPWSDD